jgi:hypothetical protein
MLLIGFTWVNNKLISYIVKTPIYLLPTFINILFYNTITPLLATYFNTCLSSYIKYEFLNVCIQNVSVGDYDVGLVMLVNVTVKILLATIVEPIRIVIELLVIIGFVVKDAPLFHYTNDKLDKFSCTGNVIFS